VTLSRRGRAGARRGAPLLPPPPMPLPLSPPPPPSGGGGGGAAPLRGELVYLTCNLPACSTLAVALYDLEHASSTTLFDYPQGSFEDGYVADNILVGDELIISLQYDSKPAQGFLSSLNLTSRTLMGSFDASQCFSMWLDPANSDTILCLALEANCAGGSQCTELRHISRSTKEDKLVASFLPDFAPYTVSCFDTKKNVIYSTFGPLTSGHNVLATIDPQTGKVLAQPTFPISTAYIELEYDRVTDKIYGVVEDAQDGAFVGTVDPASGAATPISAKAALNTTMWNQFNTISTIAPEIGKRALVLLACHAAPHAVSLREHLNACLPLSHFRHALLHSLPLPRPVSAERPRPAPRRSEPRDGRDHLRRGCGQVSRAPRLRNLLSAATL
jgi:hypothetical protein